MPCIGNDGSGMDVLSVYRTKLHLLLPGSVFAQVTGPVMQGIRMHVGEWHICAWTQQDWLCIGVCLPWGL